MTKRNKQHRILLYLFFLASVEGHVPQLFAPIIDSNALLYKLGEEFTLFKQLTGSR